MGVGWVAVPSLRQWESSHRYSSRAEWRGEDGGLSEGVMVVVVVSNR